MSYAMLCQPTHQTVGRPVYPLSLDYPTPPFCLSQRSLGQVNTTVFNSKRVYTCTFKIFTYFLHMDLDTHKTSQNQSNQFGWERNFWKSCSCLVRLHNNAVSLTNERRHINNFIRGRLQPGKDFVLHLLRWKFYGHPRKLSKCGLLTNVYGRYFIWRAKLGQLCCRKF